MNLGFPVFTVVVIFHCVITAADFSPVEWNVPPSEQCGEYSNPDLTEVLATLTQMILGNNSYVSLSKSCMEIKERSPDSPSGYYTISNGTGGMLLLSTATWTISTPAQPWNRH